MTESNRLPSYGPIVIALPRIVLSLATFIIFLVALYSGSRPAVAQEGVSAAVKPSNSRMEVTSANMLLKYIGKDIEVTLEGPVKIKQDDMVLSCDRLVGVLEQEKRSRSDPDGKHKSRDATNSVKSAVATGNVKVAKGSIKAEAGKAVFDNVKRTVTLSEGPPKVWQGPHTLTAPTIIIYLDEERAELLGGIKTIIGPAEAGKKKEE